MPSMYGFIVYVDNEYFEEDIVGEYVDCHLACARLVNISHRYYVRKTYVVDPNH
jgi:hypothetical protein